jgi:hypothetical protein
MDKAERLDLAVRARLASIRADQVRERTELLERQYAPVSRAIEAYVEQYGRDADLFDDFDVFVGLVIQHGGGNLGREDVLTGMEMYVERAAAASEAADAVHRLHEAMGDHQGSVLKWVGCTRKQFVSRLNRGSIPDRPTAHLRPGQTAGALGCDAEALELRVASC